MSDEEDPEQEASASVPLLPSKETNREILKAKLVYLFYLGANASLTAYLPVYFKQIDMNDIQTGILASIKPFVTFISAPLWGGIADRTGRHKIILLVAVVLYTLLMTAMYPISLTKNNGIIHGNMSTNGTVNNITQAQVKNSIDVGKCAMEKHSKISLNQGVMDYIRLSNGSSRNNSSTVQHSGLSNELKFWLLFILLVVSFFFMATVTPIMDATVVAMASSADYGKQRLWGAIGFGVFGLLSGVLASGGKLSGEVDEKADFLPPFILFFALNALVFVAALRMKVVVARKPSAIVFQHVKVLLKDARVMLFVIEVLIIGISSGVITWFLFLFLKDLGGSQTLLGISIAVCAFSEVIVFQFAGKLINILGNFKLLFLSLAAFIVRLLGYSYLYDPWWVLPIELLHGFTYAAMWSSCVAYGSSISPPQVVTTVIGLLTGVHFGLGWGLGGVLGGIVYQYYGARVLFRGCAVMCGIGMVLQLLTEMVLKRLQ